jgi:cbb3-type cytochrome oxidase subunit 3
MAVTTFFLGIAYAIGLYVLQKARKNELDYDL